MGEGKIVAKIALSPTNCLEWQINELFRHGLRYLKLEENISGHNLPMD